MRHPGIRLALLVAVAAVAAGTLSSTVGAEEAPLGYVVVLRDEVKGPAQVAREHAERFDGSLLATYEHALKGYAAKFTEAEIEELRKDPKIVSIEPDVQGEGLAQTTPAGINRIFAAANSSIYINQTSDRWATVDVAVLDSGIDQNLSEELYVFRRTDCLMGCVDGSGTAVHWHGTHVAGTIAAIDDGSGVVGVASGARLWSVKVLNDNSQGTFATYLNGLDWVAEHSDEIEVINSSVGYYSSGSPALDKAQQELNEAGVINIAAAGNDNRVIDMVPAISDKVVTVSAIADYNGSSGGFGNPPSSCSGHGPDDHRATFSNYGPKVDVTAPGVCILSTLVGGGYGYRNGTSMAAPHVAGAAALLAMQKDPDSAADVEWIKKTLEEEGNLNWTDTSGDGIKEPLLDVRDGTLFDMRLLPEAESGPVSDQQATSLVLHGMVNPGNDSTTYQFEYGPTTSYGAKAPASPKAMLGTVPAGEPVSEPLTNLTPSTTYHYRLVATNSKGTVYGADRTFTTPRRYVPRFDAESY
ncbi:MAG TPA: S8 family serine peptidase, partial [Solirubrobacterales bacterium]|nr:S8 family serine peptidase [Solirubrobacterales bacterium]